jgi:hypothetical protein
MGVCASKAEHSGIIKKSILNRFIPEGELNDFSALWSTETYQLSRYIRMNTNTAMYLVVSGQIHVVLQRRVVQFTGPVKQWKFVDPITVQVFEAGDIVHLFNTASLISEGYMVLDGLYLSLIPKPVKGGSVQIAVLDNNALQEYLKKQRSDSKACDNLKWLSELNVSVLAQEYFPLKNSSSAKVRL